MRGCPDLVGGVAKRPSPSLPSPPPHFRPGLHALLHQHPTSPALSTHLSHTPLLPRAPDQGACSFQSLQILGEAEPDLVPVDQPLQGRVGECRLGGGWTLKEQNDASEGHWGRGRSACGTRCACAEAHAQILPPCASHASNALCPGRGSVNAPWLPSHHHPTLGPTQPASPSHVHSSSTH